MYHQVKTNASVMTQQFPVISSHDVALLQVQSGGCVRRSRKNIKTVVMLMTLLHLAGRTQSP